LSEFGIRTFNLSLNSVTYDDVVERQIQQQQAAKMQVQTAIANAKKAEQDAITAQKNGEAEAAKAKWEQEVFKAKAVTEAQQKLEVAKLDADSAEQFKRAETLRGEGEANRRRLVMQADGALDKKLSAMVDINKAYAEALGKGNIALVPQIVSGGGAGSSNGLNLVDLLTFKTAKELGLDMQMTGAQNTHK
jgi:hypothetical protein